MSGTAFRYLGASLKPICRTPGGNYVTRPVSNPKFLSTTRPLRRTVDPVPPLSPLRRTPSILRKLARYSAILVGSTALGISTVIGVIFVHDAFTYTEKHVDRVPVSPLALHPELGGPNKLPIARILVDDDEVGYICDVIFANLLVFPNHSETERGQQSFG